MQCVERDEELNYKENLIDLVVQFIQFLDGLLDEGKITSGQYEGLTKSKLEFLKQCNLDGRNI